MDLSKEYNVELPITQTIYAIVKEHKDPKDMLEQLFLRSIKKE
jgi:glycerol-3-phosphate dehydrogenase (NAD(P)+)